MDSDLETKCENMMNIVVETRKKLGKACVDYEKKSTLIENKILNYKLEMCANYKCTSKHALPVIDSEDFEDIDKFLAEMSSRRRRIEDLRMKIRNAQDIVCQQKSNDVGRRLQIPLTIENLLTRCESK